MIDTGHDVDLSNPIINDGGASTGPEAATRTIGGVIENGFLLQGGLVIGKQPTMIAVAEANVDFIGDRIQGKPCPLVASGVAEWRI